MRTEGMHNVDIYEEDFAFLNALKRCSKVDKENPQYFEFSSIAATVNEMIKAYYYFTVQKKMKLPLDDNGYLLVDMDK